MSCWQKANSSVCFWRSPSGLSFQWWQEKRRIKAQTFQATVDEAVFVLWEFLLALEQPAYIFHSHYWGKIGWNTEQSLFVVVNRFEAFYMYFKEIQNSLLHFTKFSILFLNVWVWYKTSKQFWQKPYCFVKIVPQNFNKILTYLWGRLFWFSFLPLHYFHSQLCNCTMDV